MKCTGCKGSGHVQDYVQWSDGLGGVMATCEACDGKGELPEDLVQELIAYKRRAINAESDLARLKTHIALYIATSEGTFPSPPCRQAPGPSSYSATWLEYLKLAAREAPRLLDAKAMICEHGDYTTVYNGEPIKCCVRRNGKDCDGKLTMVKKVI